MSRSFSSEKYSGKKIGSFVIKEKIGQGGMAIVFRGVSEVDGQEVAIKIMHPSLKAEPQCIKRIFREADIASKLKHPNIVRVFAVERVDGLAALVMELVKGRSLYLTERDKGAFPLKEAIPVMGGILSALKFAHSKKVIHRDIKPENVLLREDGSPVLTDFGIAKPLEATKLTKTGQSLGTPYYMSPEQIRGQADIDFRSDIYSAGVLFYELLTGKVPFDGDDPVSISYSHVHNAPVIPSSWCPDISAAADLFVLKAMEKERSYRYQSVKEMEQDLDRLERGDPLNIELHMDVACIKKTGWESNFSLILMIVLAAATLMVLLVLVLDDGSVPGLWNRLESVVGDSLFSEQTLSSRIESYIGAGQYKQAVELLDKEEKNILILSDERVKVGALLYDDGERNFIEGKDELALILFKESFIYDSKRADTAFQLGKIYLKVDKPGMAAKFFGHTMRLLEPAEAVNFINKNEELYFARLPKGELAAIGFELYMVGKRLYVDGRYEDALGILRKSLHYKSDQIPVHKLLTDLYEKTGDEAKVGYHRRQIEALRK
jgi:serine/threonine protein kinase